jgi:hypothetical protein
MTCKLTVTAPSSITAVGVITTPVLRMTERLTETVEPLNR